VELQEGTNDVPTTVHKNLVKTTFPIDFTDGLKPHGIVKSLEVKLL
jgi:hypothetical protein